MWPCAALARGPPPRDARREGHRLRRVLGLERRRADHPASSRAPCRRAQPDPVRGVAGASPATARRERRAQDGAQTGPRACAAARGRRPACPLAAGAPAPRQRHGTQDQRPDPAADGRLGRGQARAARSPAVVVRAAGRGRWSQTVRPQQILYYITDDHAAKPGIDAASFRAAEDRFARRADVILASAPELVRRMGTLNENVHYAPAVTDTRLFASALEPGPIDAGMQALAEPRVVFIGRDPRRDGRHRADGEGRRDAPAVVLCLRGAGRPGRPGARTSTPCGLPRTSTCWAIARSGSSRRSSGVPPPRSSPTEPARR